jgi:hypothetical protein
MGDLITSYWERRFAELESQGFRPIIGSPGSMSTGTLRAYSALPGEDRLRYRRFVANRSAAFWNAGSSDRYEGDDAWFARFIQSCFPLEYPDAARPLARGRDLRKG